MKGTHLGEPIDEGGSTKLGGKTGEFLSVDWKPRKFNQSISLVDRKSVV